MIKVAENVLSSKLHEISKEPFQLAQKYKQYMIEFADFVIFFKTIAIF